MAPKRAFCLTCISSKNSVPAQSAQHPGPPVHCVLLFLWHVSPVPSGGGRSIMSYPGKVTTDLADRVVTDLAIVLPASGWRE